jgi:murein DD-endopeptidase MepM/ murein hydrolase activator NlpD
VIPENTCFTERLIGANGLDPKDFHRWAFCPGMLFQSPDKWWGDHGRRDFPHEGIDLCLYTDPTGGVRRLDEHTRIPVISDGVVKAVFTDYLGQAVIVEHECHQRGRGHYLSVYAHTKPVFGMHPGVAVKEGDVIATIADTSRSKAKIAPHLHFTIGLPSPDLMYENFVWNHMRDPDLVSLLNPLMVIDRPFRVIDSMPPVCEGL